MVDVKRRVPEAFTTGSDRHNAQKAWLDGFDTAGRDFTALLQAVANAYEGREVAPDFIAHGLVQRAYFYRAGLHTARAEPAHPQIDPIDVLRRLVDELELQYIDGNPVWPFWINSPDLVLRVYAVLGRSRL